MSDYSPNSVVLWLDIPVADLNRAISFYQAVLDHTAFDHRPNSATATIQFGSNGSGLTLIEASFNNINHVGPVPYLNCNKRLHSALAAVRLNGGLVIDDINSMAPFGYRAVIEDPDGNKLALHAAQLN